MIKIVMFHKRAVAMVAVFVYCLSSVSVTFCMKTTPHTLRTNVQTTDKLTLKIANTMINAVFVESRILFAQPSAVVVLDEGGHVIALQRQDDAALLRSDIAYAKAYGALGMGMGSRGLANKAKEIPDFFNGAISASKGRLIPAPGGVLVLNSHRRIIGAVGVSGDSSDNDERAAIFGIKSVNLTPKVD